MLAINACLRFCTKVLQWTDRYFIIVFVSIKEISYLVASTFLVIIIAMSQWLVG